MTPLTVRSFLAILATAVALTGMAGCAGTAPATLAPLPVWRAASATVEQFDVIDAVAKIAPTARVDTSDAKFSPVSHEWAMQLVAWSHNAVQALSVRTDSGRLYAVDTFDCDKFAKAFSLAAELSAGRKMSGAQVLVGRIFVEQRHPFGGVSAGGYHALNFFVSERGVYVVEPQTAKTSPLSEYPNKQFVYSVKIGG